MDALQAIANAKEIAFKITMKAGTLTLEPSTDEVAEFMEAVKNIYEKDIMSYVTNAGLTDDEIQYVATNYPITVEE